MNRIAKFSASNSIDLKTSSISEIDVVTIWNALSQYIHEEMNKKRGVRIPNFGVFTFVEQRLDIAQRTQLVRSKPYLMLSEKLLQTHSIKQNVEHHNQTIPINLINYAQISVHANNKYSRVTIETVLREAFTALQHFLREEGQIKVDFPSIGTFKIVLDPSRAQDIFDFLPEFTAKLP